MTAANYVAEYKRTPHPPPAMPDLGSWLASQPVRHCPLPCDGAAPAVVASYCRCLFPSASLLQLTPPPPLPPNKASNPSEPVVSGLLHRPDACADPLSPSETRKQGLQGIAALGACHDVNLEPKLARPPPPLLPVTDNEALWLNPCEIDHTVVWDPSMGKDHAHGKGWKRHKGEGGQWPSSR